MGVADAIRAEIAKISASDLVYAKPSRILPSLEAAGIEITASVRSATSKLLANAKEKAVIYDDEEDVINFDSSTIESRKSIGRRELAMQLVEACGGDFDLVRGEIARLEQFAKKILGA